MTNLRKISVCITALALTYAAMCAVAALLCPYALCFRESIGTFYYKLGWIYITLRQPGGVAELIARYLVQWCVTPVAAVCILGGLLTAVAAAVAVTLRRLCGTRAYSALAFIPAVLSAIPLADIDYRPAGTVAFALACCSMALYPVDKDFKWRLATAIVSCLVVWIVAGQTAMLLAICIVLVEIILDPRQSAWFALCIADVWLLALADTHSGQFSGLAQALWPSGYYSGWSTHNGAFNPWIALWLTILAASVLKVLRNRSAKSSKASRKRVVTVVAATTVCAAAVIALQLAGTDTSRNDFMRLSYMQARDDHDGVIAAMRDIADPDVALQNMLCRSLAEKQRLAGTALRYPLQGPEALYDLTTKDRYSYMTLSDVFYTMGLIQLSRRFAFEANEAVGNLSPRMLKRLVDTNLITGDYAVAAKYIDLLSATWYYHDWAEQRRSLLGSADGVARDPELAAKRACLFPDNRFAGYRGLDDDMMQVLRANPSHRPTQEYAGMLQLMRCNVPRFVEILDELRDSTALAMPLPEHFQEAVAVASFASGTDMATGYQVHPAVLDKCRSFWAEHMAQPGTLWQYMRGRKTHAPEADRFTPADAE